MTNKSKITILLVEDNPGHARLIEKILRRFKFTNIITLTDGQQALDYFFSNGKYKGTSPASPLLVLLELNLPILNGDQVLKQIKANPKTSKIPVIILTTTDDRYVVSKCHELGCNIYITKSVDSEKFSETIQNLGRLLSVVTIPNGD